MTEDFDYIISNPPYGNIGDKITQNVIQHVNYNTFVNMLPLKDYSLENACHINVDSIHICPPNSFRDADIITHFTKIDKNNINNFKDFKDYCISTFTIDKPMKKFMQKNVKRQHYAIDAVCPFKLKYDVNCTFVYHHFNLCSHHACGMPPLNSDKAKAKNEYNLNNNVILGDGVNVIKGVDTAIVFNTPEEKNNFVKFYKENLNFINRMIAIPFFTVRDESVCWPKVDWTREWTLEELLKDFDYTDDEIEEVMVTMNIDYRVMRSSDINRYF